MILFVLSVFPVKSAPNHWELAFYSTFIVSVNSSPLKPKPVNIHESILNHS